MGTVRGPVGTDAIQTAALPPTKADPFWLDLAQTNFALSSFGKPSQDAGLFGIARALASI
jgi:hypothetical protein